MKNWYKFRCLENRMNVFQYERKIASKLVNPANTYNDNIRLVYYTIRHIPTDDGRRNKNFCCHQPAGAKVGRGDQRRQQQRNVSSERFA